MLGRIIKIDGEIIKVENLKKQAMINIIGYYVVFEGDKNLVGEIVFVNEEFFDIELIGEIKNNTFLSGVENFPSITSKCRIIYKGELELILGKQDISKPDTLLLGKSGVFDGYNVSVNINDFFSNHFAIIGNTGCGKSCGLSRILQNLFSRDKKLPVNSHIIIFDVYGEYRNVVNSFQDIPSINVKNYSPSNDKNSNDQIIKIPPYFLEADDLALLLHLNDSTLISTLEKTLSYVYIFKGNDDLSKKYKNDIIAKALLDILSSGKSAQQIRDQALAFLSKYNTDTLNMDTVVTKPGYTKTLRQCLIIDNQGKLLSLQELVEYLNTFSDVALDKLNLKPTFYTLDDLYSALEFAIVSEGSLSSLEIFEKLLILKTRLYGILNSELKSFFEYDEFITREEFVKRIFTNDNGEKVQLVDVSFNGIDDRFAKVITKIYSKIFYKYVTSLENKGTYPINIIIEEAHRYIQQDNDVQIIGYNIFDRIAKEGRKYGILLGMITQRLTELSPTALSQCSNFIMFRMFYPEDIKIAASMFSNLTTESIERIKILRQGAALLSGSAFKIPLVVQFDMPNPVPTSRNVELINQWFE